MKRNFINILLALIILNLSPGLISAEEKTEGINNKVAETFKVAESDATLFNSRVVTGSKDGYNFKGTLDVKNPIFRKPRASATTESLDAPLHEIIAEVKSFVNNVQRGHLRCSKRNTTKCPTGELKAPSRSTDNLRFWGYHAVVDDNLSSTWTGFTGYIY